MVLLFTHPLRTRRLCIVIERKFVGKMYVHVWRQVTTYDAMAHGPRQ